MASVSQCFLSFQRYLWMGWMMGVTLLQALMGLELDKTCKGGVLLCKLSEPRFFLPASFFSHMKPLTGPPAS